MFESNFDSLKVAQNTMTKTKYKTKKENIEGIFLQDKNKVQNIDK